MSIRIRLAIFFLVALAAFAQSGSGPVEAQTVSYKLAFQDASAPEIDFWAGKGYRNITLSSSLPKNLALQGHYFGALGGDVGALGITRQWQPKKWLASYGGAGVIFGRGEPAGPAVLAGVEIEGFGWTAEAKVVQALRESARYNHDHYFQSSIGRQHGAFWFGGCGEFLHHREEREWSGGPCVQWSLKKTGLFFGASVFFSGHGVPTPVFGFGFNPALKRE